MAERSAGFQAKNKAKTHLKPTPAMPMTRRAFCHDYCSRCFYLITMTKAPGVPDFSLVTGNPEAPRHSPERPRTVLLTVGEAIEKAICRFRQEFPAVTIMRRVVMPDHIHLVVYARERLPRQIGYYIAALKGACSRTAWEMMPQADFSSRQQPVLEKNFNDRILFRDIPLDNFLRYVDDNPRRLLVRRASPDFFRRVNTLTVGGRRLSAYGNLFLLGDPQKAAVRVSRSFTPAELTRRKRQWLATVENGGVLVSPFISQAEKRVRDWTIANGGKVIQVMPCGFPKRYKPPGESFELCCRGRLLQVAPAGAPAAGGKLTRELSMRLNALAEEIAAGNVDNSL